MIVYRPIAPLTVGNGRLGAALIAMLVAAFCGTAAFSLDESGVGSQPGFTDPAGGAMTVLAATADAAAGLDGIAGWVVNLMEALGAPGAGLVVALENLFPPIPSEVILPLAGFTASRGGFTLLEAIFWTTAGSVLGAYVLYLLGAWLGRQRTRALIGKIPFVALEDVNKVEAWFLRHGYKAVFLARCSLCSAAWSRYRRGSNACRSCRSWH
jgi:membrane protein YqaA with SNARE-associated domain